MNRKHIADDVIKNLNEIRNNPQTYIQYLKALRNLYQGIYYRANGRYLKTLEGVQALDQLITDLNKNGTVPPLLRAQQLCNAADNFCDDIGSYGIIDHKNSNGDDLPKRLSRHCKISGKVAEVIELSGTDPLQIVTELLIDDGLATRKRRRTLMNPKFSLVGVACGPHASHNNVTVIILAEKFMQPTLPRVIPNAQPVVSQVINPAPSAISTGQQSVGASIQRPQQVDSVYYANNNNIQNIVAEGLANNLSSPSLKSIASPTQKQQTTDSRATPELFNMMGIEGGEIHSPGIKNDPIQQPFAPAINSQPNMAAFDQHRNSQAYSSAVIPPNLPLNTSGSLLKSEHQIQPAVPVPHIQDATWDPNFTAPKPNIVSGSGITNNSIVSKISIDKPQQIVDNSWHPDYAGVEANQLQNVNSSINQHKNPITNSFQNAITNPFQNANPNASFPGSTAINQPNPNNSMEASFKIVEPDSVNKPSYLPRQSNVDDSPHVTYDNYIKQNTSSVVLEDLIDKHKPNNQYNPYIGSRISGIGEQSSGIRQAISYYDRGSFNPSSVQAGEGLVGRPAQSYLISDINSANQIGEQALNMQAHKPADHAPVHSNSIAQSVSIMGSQVRNPLNNDIAVNPAILNSGTNLNNAPHNTVSSNLNHSFDNHPPVPSRESAVPYIDHQPVTLVSKILKDSPQSPVVTAVSPQTNITVPLPAVVQPTSAIPMRTADISIPRAIAAAANQSSHNKNCLIF